MISLDFLFNARGLFRRFNIGSEQSPLFLSITASIVPAHDDR